MTAGAKRTLLSLGRCRCKYIGQTVCHNDEPYCYVNRCISCYDYLLYMIRLYGAGTAAYNEVYKAWLNKVKARQGTKFRRRFKKRQHD